MSTDIKIIERDVQDSRLLSREEREARMKEIAATSKIPQYHFENFLELEDLALSIDNKRAKPDIPALLLRKLLMYDAVLPIVTEKVNRLKTNNDVYDYFDIPVLRKFGSDDFSDEKSDEKTGGKSLKIRKKKPKNRIGPVEGKPIPDEKFVVNEKPAASKTDTTKSIASVQVNGVKKFIHLEDIAGINKKNYDKLVYQTTNNETIQVSGIYINPYAPMVKYFRDKYPWSMNVFVSIMSGTYSTEYIHNRLFSPYHVTNPNDGELFLNNMREFIPLGFSHTKTPQTPNDKSNIYYIFTDETHMQNICTSLFEYLLYLEKIWAPLHQSYLITKAFQYSENITDFEAKNYSNAKETKEKETKTKEKETKGKQSVMPKFSELFKLMVTMLTKFQNLPNSVETKDVPIEIDSKILDFVKQLEPLLTRNRNIKYESSLYHDLWIADMLKVFEQFMDGKQKDFMHSLKDMLINQSKDEIINAESSIKKQHAFSRKLKEMRYRWIYIEKFGFDKFQAMYASMMKNGEEPTSMLSANVKKITDVYLMNVPIMTILPKNVRDIVEVEFQRVEKYADALSKNNCPHLDIENEMRMAVDNTVRLQKYNDIKKFIPEKERNISTGIPQTMITCTNCKFPLICPHVRDLNELEKSRKTDDETRAFINKYADVPIESQFYCKICGEPISDDSSLEGTVAFAEGQVEDYHYADDELRDFIWQEASHLVRNFTETSGVQTNKFTNKFIGTVVTSVYEFIFAIEKKLIKSKTSSIDEIRNKKKLFTVIYVMALLVKIISENSSRLRFVANKRDFKNEKTKVSGLTGKFEKIPVGKLLGMALNIIVSSQNVLITKIEGMSNTVVQNSLLKAFKVINTLLGKTVVPQVKDEEIITTLLLDPLYRYIISAHVWTSLSKNVVSNETVGNKAVTAFKKLKDSYLDPNVSLGKDIKEMEKSTYVFEGIKEPKFDMKYVELFDKITDLSKTDADKNVNPVDALYTGYWIKSFLHTFEYIHSRMYIHPLWKVDILEDADETLRIEVNKPYQEYFDKGKTLAKSERVLFDLMLYYKMRTYQVLPFIKNSEFITDSEPDKYLAQKYGDHLNTKFNFKLGFEEPKKVGFHFHKWDIIVYDTNGVKKAFTLKDINKKTEEENADKHTWHVDDVYCSICFYPKSTITTTYVEKKIDPVELLESNQTLESFYNFYSNQCPALSGKPENLHEFNSKETCSKCGYVKGEHNKTYFTKWLPVFNKEVVSEQNDEELEPTDWTTVKMPQSIEHPKIGDDIKKWKFNPNVITEVANATHGIVEKKFIIKAIKKTAYYNLWLNLGLSQSLDFDDLMSGKATPYKDITILNAKIRETQIGNYIYKLMVDYNMLKNHKNLTLSPEMKELITPELLKVLDKLPDFTNDFTIGYNQLKRTYYKNDDVHNLASWVLEFLCKTILKIYKAAKETGPFLAFYIGEIFDSEKNISKPKDNKMAQVLANTKSDDTAIMQDDTVSDAFNTVSGPDKDPVGYEGMDYDGHNEEANT